jgi:AraC-like DNA-binding protein
VVTLETQYSRPSLAVSQFVHYYVQRKGGLGAASLTIPVKARSCALLDFELGDMLQIRSCSSDVTRRVEPAALVGLETKVQNHLLVDSNFENFQVHFRPAALKQLFGLPMPELTNQNYAAHAILGSKVSQLRQRLGEARSFEERVQLANALIVAFSSDRPDNDSIDLAASKIRLSHGNCRIDLLARDTGFSMRNFQRRFRECVGISPKLFARIVRFESLLKIKAAAPQMSWMNAAHEAGYHDQMHMIHDFREFSNRTPTGISGDPYEAFTPHSNLRGEASTC